jgi:hypothetical protein
MAAEGAVLAFLGLICVWLLTRPTVYRGPTPVAALQNNLKQLAIAMHNHAGEFGSLPAASICDQRTGRPLLSWRVKVLPYIEQEDLFARFRLDEPWDSRHNFAVASAYMPPIYRDPLDPKGIRRTPYRVFVGNGAPFEWCQGPRLNEQAGGARKTILIVEAAEKVFWSKPDELEFHPDRPLPPLGRGDRAEFYAVFGDERVRRLAHATPEEQIKALVTCGADPID